MVFGGVFWKAEGCGAEISVAHSRLRQRLERIGPPVLHPVGEPLVLATDLRILDALQGGTGISNREIAALIDRSPRATLGGPLLTAFPQGLYLPSSPQPPAPSPQPPAPSLGCPGGPAGAVRSLFASTPEEPWWIHPVRAWRRRPSGPAVQVSPAGSWW